MQTEEKIMADYLKWNIKPSKLIGMGYEFNKLFANNYKVYSKNVAGYNFWLWVKDRRLEIKDWHHCTGAIIKFYKDNISKLKPFTFQLSDDRYMKVQVNPDNCFVQMFDYDEYSKVFNHPDSNHAWDNWIAKYGDWHNEIYLIEKAMKKVLEEIKNIS